MKIYISKKPEKKGGGSNTFAWNFTNWAKENPHHSIVSRIELSDRAIIIANHGDLQELKRAKEKGVYIIHRIDEYFEKNEDAYRTEKHNKMFQINKYADMTVFQSEFTYQNAYPFFKPEKYRIILNGGNQKKFHPLPGDKTGQYIGHITWGIGKKQRLDILFEKAKESLDETFLLVGRHQESEFDFNLRNVKLLGRKSRNRLPRLMRKMKILFYPSQNDPCPNTAIEAILSGVPVCYNTPGGTSEVVKDCGVPLSGYQDLVDNFDSYRRRCLERTDLYFDKVAEKYLSLK
jgi:glycosyltransferase involved in cell wall biosynthesis